MDRAVNEITALSCWPFVEQVEVDVTFNLPGLTIDDSNPPRTKKSLKTYPADDIRDLLSGLKRNLLIQFTTENGSTDISTLTSYASYLLPEAYAPTAGLGRRALVNGFFGSMILGKDGIPADQLSGRGNEARLVEAAENLYGRAVV